MKWIRFADEYPSFASDTIKFLVTDGIDVLIAYMDHDEIYLVCEPMENELVLISWLTHWAPLENVPLPKN